jgi:hypothetical protein
MNVEFSRSLSLTRDFTLGEFVVSSDHPETLEGIHLTPEEIQKIYLLAILCLQPLRDMFGPMIITSAYRSARLNHLVNGAPTSQHCYAEAVDFKPRDADPMAIYLWLHNFLKWPGEVILYPSEGRLHVSLPRLGVQMDHFIKQGHSITIST